MFKKAERKVPHNPIPDLSIVSIWGCILLDFSLCQLASLLQVAQSCHSHCFAGCLPSPARGAGQPSHVRVDSVGNRDLERLVNQGLGPPAPVGGEWLTSLHVQGGFSEGTETRNCSLIRAFLCDPWSFPTLVSLNGSRSPHQWSTRHRLCLFCGILWSHGVFIFGKVDAFLVTFPLCRSQ